MKGDCKKSTLALIGSSTSSSNHCLISYQIKCIKKIGKTTFYISFMKLGKRNNFFFLHLNVPFKSTFPPFNLTIKNIWLL